MNGKSPMISHAPPFVLRLSKDERRVFQQNQIVGPEPGALDGVTERKQERWPVQ